MMMKMVILEKLKLKKSQKLNYFLFQKLGTFYCVGKVASKLPFVQQKSLNENLEKYWIHINDKKTLRNCNEILNCNIKWGNTIPDVWIEPKNSIILQIKASELHPNDSFGLSHALRFARIEKIRNDKIWNECMTLEEYEELCKVQEI